MNDSNELTVNDGKGFFDSDGLIDTLVVDCNELMRSISSGMYVQFCGKIVEMVQKLSTLKNGIKADRNSLEEQNTQLKQMRNEFSDDAPAVSEDEI